MEQSDQTPPVDNTPPVDPTKKISKLQKLPQFSWGILAIVALFFGIWGAKTLLQGFASNGIYSVSTCKKIASTYLDCADDSAQGNIVRYYQTVFNRKPDALGEQFWSGRLAGHNYSELAVMNFFVNSDEFRNAHRGITNDAFVRVLYQNGLHKAPDAAGLAYWTGQLNSRTLTRGQVAIRIIADPAFRQALRPEVLAYVAPVTTDNVTFNVASVSKLQAGATFEQSTGKQVKTTVHDFGGGLGVVLGGTIYRLFGDPAFDHPQLGALEGTVWRSNILGTSDVSTPTTVNFTVDQVTHKKGDRWDNVGFPLQALPYSPGEAAYNKAGNDPTVRYIPSSTAVVAISDSQALVYYEEIKGAGTGDKNITESLGVGVGIIKTGDKTVTRLPALAPNQQFYPLLFDKAKEPAQLPAQLFQFRKAVVQGGYVYIYSACSANFFVDVSNPAAAQPEKCPVARVRVNQALDRSAYEFYAGTAASKTGDGWTKDINKLLGPARTDSNKQTTNIIPEAQRVVTSHYGYYVFYNAALHKYVQLVVPTWTKQLRSKEPSREIDVSYSATPEGPWTTPVKLLDLDQLDNQLGFSPYNVKPVADALPFITPGLPSDDGYTIYLSYNRSFPGFKGDIPWVRLVLLPK